MKFILSRKGFDSSNGGVPSPILKTEHCYNYISLPIPSQNSDISYDDVVLCDDYSVAQFLNDVSPNKDWSKEYCHLDPDIRVKSLKKRSRDWKKNFGQVKQAQSHLENNGIVKGDVFLFFGWFQYAELKNGKFRFMPNKDYPNGFHAIYGYLQINEIYKVNKKSVPSWLDYHPHVKYKNEFEFKNDNNTVYVAKKLFDYPKHFNKNGSVLFTPNEKLILTKKGSLKRTVWELPKEFLPSNGIRLTYNPSYRWHVENDKAILNSAFRGQEFIFKDVEGIVERWGIDLIKNSTVTD